MTEKPLTIAYVIFFFHQTGRDWGKKKKKSVGFAFVPIICGIEWMYALEKQQQCDPFITDCKNSWKKPSD